MQESVAIEAIQDASVHVFSTMLGKKLTPGVVGADDGAGASEEGIVAQISVVGACSITSLICCSSTVGCAIASAMLMQNCPGVDEEVLDAMGEIANMIMGTVKTELESQLGAVALSIPTVIFGKNFRVRNHSRQWMVAPFDMDEGKFSVKVCFEAETPVRRGLSLAAHHQATANGSIGTAGG